MGAAARNGGFFRRAAYLRLAPLDHVLAENLLLLRASETKISRAVCPLDRRLEAPQVWRVDQASKAKLYHLIRITHRDEVEPPITDWLQEAYMLSDELSKPGASKSTPAEKQTAARKRRSTQQPKKVQRKAGPASKRGL